MALNSNLRIAITCCLLLAAIALYVAGSTTGFGVLIVLGAGFELTFWVRTFDHFNRKKRRLEELREED